MKLVATPTGREYLPTTFSIIRSAVSSDSSESAQAFTCSGLRPASCASFSLLSGTDSL